MGLKVVSTSVGNVSLSLEHVVSLQDVDGSTFKVRMVNGDEYFVSEEFADDIFKAVNK
jgi:hypothetical protein